MRKSRLLCDLVLLLPWIVGVGFVYHGGNHMFGAMSDLVIRQYVLYTAAWALSIGLSFLVLHRVKRFSTIWLTTIRCLIAFLLFWPLFGVSIVAAEGWTISHRVAEGTLERTLEADYVYAKASGMGYASGFTGGWPQVLATARGWMKWGFIVVPLWLPFLGLGAYLFSRWASGTQPKNEQNKTLQTIASQRG